ncbi:5'-methylthioadenosine/S-adenosylhomocysteine nucleosidase [Companilactobacillus crustorum]|uniref:adenosylhomocysteine nucleosidase n=3 Tax=Companilactobacillus TaxID=2767879 RepID=A0A837RJ00_9LACO|nr:5'-methylthioadenosine/adenosylhomocysteine nucleosidase [Companilactobacillus crustorum]APU71597.1 5'-methylthioadenosine/S-adenosylhomocysteine nucleosidase [Companilactobacillus crustorum]KRK42784.1 methylthioadenosine nucleosidase (nucleoside phosphorylase) [Companilactobacillus crustorum JCM 15951]KRO20418.1 methylthioadenosine nucleosidase (nucleoside phosphorylase) [Companilactobacillus crustorum]WDT66382.1 5'-methylthioadenosine/adenosylhomocysteine nucleosidase [Companilactobacillus
MKIGVIVPMEEEIKLMKESLTDIHQESVAGVDITIGNYKNHEVYLAQSGIGKVQAGMTTTLINDRYQPDFVVNTGSAGGIGEGLHIGDVVISDKMAYHDVDATGFGYKVGQLPQQELYFNADADYVKEIAAAAKRTGLTSRVGLIVTGDQFVDAKEKIATIKKSFPDALAAEMEGAAVAQVCTQFHTSFVVIRSMSDVGDENASVNFDEFVLQAGRKSVTMLLNFLDQE